MKFDILKTRRGKLEAKISEHILKKNIKGILDAVDEYEKDNLDTIEKLKNQEIGNLIENITKFLVNEIIDDKMSLRING